MFFHSQSAIQREKKQRQSQHLCHITVTSVLGPKWKKTKRNCGWNLEAHRVESAPFSWSLHTVVVVLARIVARIPCGPSTEQWPSPRGRLGQRERTWMSRGLVSYQCGHAALDFLCFATKDVYPFTNKHLAANSPQVVFTASTCVNVLRRCNKTGSWACWVQRWDVLSDEAACECFLIAAPRWCEKHKSWDYALWPGT